MIVLANTDCRTLASRLPANQFDLVFADPPWGGSPHPWDRHVPGWVALMGRLLKPSGSLWMLSDMRHLLKVAPDFNDWHLIQDIVSEQANGNGATLRPLFREVHSFGIHYRPPGSQLKNISLCSPRNSDTGLIQRSVMQGYTPKRKVHPHQQPLDVVRKIIESCVPAGGHVFDPFAGSGTVAIACAELGINCLSAEIDYGNFGIAESRLQSEGISYTTDADGTAYNAFFGDNTNGNRAAREHPADRGQEQGTRSARSAVPDPEPVRRTVRVRARLRR